MIGERRSRNRLAWRLIGCRSVEGEILSMQGELIVRLFARVSRSNALRGGLIYPRSACVAKDTDTMENLRPGTGGGDRGAS